jgi:glycosyltransferase involved in cell wall biosynthesis
MKKGKEQLYVEAFPLLGDAPSGIGKLLYSMIEALLRNKQFTDRYEMTLVVSLRKKHQLDKWHFDDRVRVIELPLPLKIINALDRFHMMIPIDLVCGRGVYLFPNYRRLPLIFSRSLTYVHDVSYLLFPETIQKRNLSFLRQAVPRAIKKSDRIVTLSEQSAHELQAAFPAEKEKIVIVPAGVDRATYAMKHKEGARDVLRGLGVQKKKYILFVGNIEPRKNIGYLLDIYVALRKKPQYHDLALLLVGGDGWRNEPLMAKIESLNMQGYTIIRPAMRVPDEDLPVLYKESFVTALMAIHEGFGMTPLEALAVSASVVVSDIPVLHEVGGEAVSYAPLNSAEKAAEIFVKASKKEPNSKVVADQLGTFTWDNAAGSLILAINETRKGGSTNA